MSVFKAPKVEIVPGSESVGSIWFTVESVGKSTITIGTGKYEGNYSYKEPYKQFASAYDCRKAAEFFTKLANVMEGKE